MPGNRSTVCAEMWTQIEGLGSSLFFLLGCGFGARAPRPAPRFLARSPPISGSEPAHVPGYPKDAKCRILWYAVSRYPSPAPGYSRAPGYGLLRARRRNSNPTTIPRDCCDPVSISRCVGTPGTGYSGIRVAEHSGTK
eukprot:3896653-Rhodomonas_salina.1